MKTTRDNFVQVLEFNRWERTRYRWEHTSDITESSYTIDITDITDTFFSFSEFNKNDLCMSSVHTSNFDEFLSFVQKRIELKELPDFDFKIFAKEHCLPLVCVSGGNEINRFRFNNEIEYTLTQQNAEIVLEIKKLRDTLERA